MAHDKKLLMPFFTTNSVKSYVEIFEARTQRYCDKALASAHTSVDMKDVLTELILETLCASVFGFDVNEHPILMNHSRTTF
ncbi:Aste57867_735 [Aphanomyces stellatus]|uniref:Aste57867_735 protein n=1 Tax=Aphanomyces stellatus TaxID=120398 RepID=A0A485K7G8_9STRA|nr:hypothetical protein As57867_000734 [Aphanomyces stellatus]VFT77959.1 Aste57867_735 [Aphanomyces stellatus]